MGAIVARCRTTDGEPNRTTNKCANWTEHTSNEESDNGKDKPLHMDPNL
jgi:hypothetical protein